MTQASDLARLTKTLLALGILSLPGFAVFAQDIDCGECHEDVAFSSTAHPDLVCSCLLYTSDAADDSALV